MPTLKWTSDQRPESPLTAAFQACRRHFVWAAVFSALLNLLYLAPTIYMLQVYDRVVPSRGQLTLLFLTLVLAFALVTLSLLDLARTRLFVRASMRLDRLLAGTILDATLARPAGSGDMLTRQAMREFDTLRQTLTGGAALSLFDAPWIPIYIVVCFLLHPLLGVLVLAGGAILLAITWRNELATKARLQRANAAASYAYISQEQSQSAADVVRALGMRRAMVARHLAERETASRLQAESSFASGGYLAATRFVRLFLQSFALGVGAWLVIGGKISAGAIFAASFLVARALTPLEQMLGAWRGVIQARSAWANLDSLLQRAQPMPQTTLPPPAGAVEVDRLVVGRPDAGGVILQGLSFRVEAGQVVAIIGPSGAGKSTLVRTIAGAGGLYNGAIRFDGAEMKDYDPERLARHIGYCPQEITLFAGTVKDNIARFTAFESQDLVDIDQRAVDAAKACGAHDMILRLPDGYDTVLGWGGKGLSSGQSQRIALARAMFGAPRLLLLDEPNAHLDIDGETTLLNMLREQKAKGVTAFVVAHRTGVLAAADKVMLLRDGRIEMYGPRDEVLARLAPPPFRAQPAANS